ncbi:MAG: helix-turn-helix domain-containing protein [Streptococcaceae bacterium]|nr:helix-turn-helix domain-containing protein [Streptococcaceae bacterium]MCH4177059.1 helix-turn-helix domain-containing protein [Streptococcaceae bacterium]
MFTIFLDKASNRKLALLRYLENQPQFMESKEKLIDTLELSDFLLNKTVDELNQDFIESELIDDIHVYLDKNNVWLVEKRIFFSNVIAAVYIRNSISFLLIESFFWGNCISISDFSDQKFISHTIVYKEFRKLKKLLAKMNIQVNKNLRLVGDETAIRDLMTFLFLSIYERDITIYPPEIMQIIEKTLEIIEKNYPDDHFSEYDRSRFIHFTAVNIARVASGNMLKHDTALKDLKLSSEIEKHIEKMTIILSPLTSEKIFEKYYNANYFPNEILRITLFFVSINLMGLSPKIIENNSETIRKLNLDFQKAVSTNFNLSPEAIDSLRLDLTRIHFKSIYVEIESLDYKEDFDITYFAENYPEYFAFCLDYIKVNKQNKYINRAKNFLFLEYVLVLVNNVPLKDILAPIKICVDFSLGNNYNEMIIRNIDKITELNIEYHSKIDTQMDMILTDVLFDETIESNFIVWASPPRPVDWGNFMEELLLIRRSKSR